MQLITEGGENLFSSYVYSELTGSRYLRQTFTYSQLTLVPILVIVTAKKPCPFFVISISILLFFCCFCPLCVFVLCGLLFDQVD